MDKKNSIDLPPGVRHIIKTLEQSGHEAYAVGGCVRDALIGIEPKDWDICTDALPGQVVSIFNGHHVIETGLKHGTVTVVLNHRPYEITTFRADGLYSDNRRPDSVSFVRNLSEDLSRRDFTINALAYNPGSGIVDLFGGYDSIRSKTIRCVGNADARLSEDALRIMRALRLASAYGFEIESITSQSIHKKKMLLKSIAAERISAELSKLLTGCGTGGILRGFTDVFTVIIPEIEAMVGFKQNNPHHHLDVWEHTVAAVCAAPSEPKLRLAALLHDIAKPLCYSEADGIGHFYGHAQTGAEMAGKILRRLKYDGDTVLSVSQMVLHHSTYIEPNHKAVRRWLSRIGGESFYRLIELKKADAMASAGQYRTDRTAELGKALSIAAEIIRQQQCFSLKDLAVNGRDLIGIGITDGITIGKTLNRLLEMVIDEAVENDKDALLSSLAPCTSPLQET